MLTLSNLELKFLVRNDRGVVDFLRLRVRKSDGGLSGWGWEDDGWGAVNKNGVTRRFPEGGWQHLIIQTREDGVSIDQIVLSAETYLTRRPERRLTHCGLRIADCGFIG